MNFNAAVEEVLKIVKRPDLRDRIEAAVKSAILRCHQSDFFYRDIVEVPVIFSFPNHLQQFTPKEVLPRYRKAKYIRYWHGGVDGHFGRFFDPIQIEASRDQYGYEKTDVFYMAGDKLQLRGSVPVSTILFGAYQYPVITPQESIQSWILEEHPYAIVYEAVAQIFRSINFGEQSQQFLAMAMEELAKVKISNVDDVPLT